MSAKSIDKIYMNCSSCGEELAFSEACPDCGYCGNCCDCVEGGSYDFNTGGDDLDIEDEY